MSLNDAPIKTRLIPNEDLSGLKVRAFAPHRLSWDAGHIRNAGDGEQAVCDDVRAG